jgi:uncharacterized protein (TIGR00255 family)
MLQSMTGYGGSQHEDAGFSFLVEIKSLNNRFLKTSIRLPDALASLEAVVEKEVRKNLSRGSVNYTLHMRNLNNPGPYEVNHAAVDKYLGNLEQVSTLHHQNNGLQIDLASILQLPGVCQLRTFSDEENEWFLKIVMDLTGEALGNLQKMRVAEGQVLLEDLAKQCGVIRENLEALASHTDEVLMNYQQRLQTRVDAMLTDAKLKLDQDMLMKEVAIFAERSDVNEEVARLTCHLEQFDKACQAEDQTGRRLDFITQEMLREANTIASKANSATISQHVVEIKVAIDRLKEQVQNVE